MKLKEFLKPEWRKILVFLIFVFIFLLYSYYEGLLFPSELSLIEWEFVFVSYSIVFFIILIPRVFLSCHFYDIIDWCSPFHEYLAYFWYFAVSYLFSCFIVWIYDKFRKVKKK